MVNFVKDHLSEKRFSIVEDYNINQTLDKLDDILVGHKIDNKEKTKNKKAILKLASEEYVGNNKRVIEGLEFLIESNYFEKNYTDRQKIKIYEYLSFLSSSKKSTEDFFKYRLLANDIKEKINFENKGVKVEIKNSIQEILENENKERKIDRLKIDDSTRELEDFNELLGPLDETVEINLSKISKEIFSNVPGTEEYQELENEEKLIKEIREKYILERKEEIAEIRSERMKKINEITFINSKNAVTKKLKKEITELIINFKPNHKISPLYFGGKSDFTVGKRIDNGFFIKSEFPYLSLTKELEYLDRDNRPKQSIEYEKRKKLFSDIEKRLIKSRKTMKKPTGKNMIYGTLPSLGEMVKDMLLSFK